MLIFVEMQDYIDYLVWVPVALGPIFLVKYLVGLHRIQKQNEGIRLTPKVGVDISELSTDILPYIYKALRPHERFSGERMLFESVFDESPNTLSNEVRQYLERTISEELKKRGVNALT